MANTVTLIREATNPSQWNYVGTAENPVDQASRGLKAKSLLQEGMWIIGPLIDHVSDPTSQCPYQRLSTSEHCINKETHFCYCFHAKLQFLKCPLEDVSTNQDIHIRVKFHQNTSKRNHHVWFGFIFCSLIELIGSRLSPHTLCSFTVFASVHLRPLHPSD